MREKKKEKKDKRVWRKKKKLMDEMKREKGEII